MHDKFKIFVFQNLEYVFHEVNFSNYEKQNVIFP